MDRGLVMVRLIRRGGDRERQLSDAKSGWSVKNGAPAPSTQRTSKAGCSWSAPLDIGRIGKSFEESKCTVVVGQDGVCHFDICRDDIDGNLSQRRTFAGTLPGRNVARIAAALSA
jgi:hypothetical protein